MGIDLARNESGSRRFRDWLRWVIRLYRRSPFRAALRWFGIGMALLLALIAGYNHYAQHSWLAYRREASLRGVTLTLSANLPSAIPAEQNLAAADPFQPYASAPFRYDPPVDLIGDYTQWATEFLPDLATATPPQFDRALKRWHELRRPYSPDTRHPTVIYLEEFERELGAIWAQILAAEARPSTQYRIDPTWPDGNRQRIPYISFRKAGQVHAIRAIVFIEAKRPTEALQELKGGLRVAEALKSDPSIVGTMVRAALIHLQLSTAWHGLQRHTWSDEELSMLTREIDRGELTAQDFRNAMASERQRSNSFVDHLHNQDLLTRASELPQTSTYLNSSAPNPIYFLPALIDGCVRQSQLELNRHYDTTDSYFDADGVCRPTLAPAPMLAASPKPAKAYFLGLFYILAPVYDRAAARFGIVIARQRQARIAIALERHRLAGGQLPPELTSLSSTQLSAIPRDPFDGKPMRYRSWPNGAFSLWSVGPQAIDDQGAPSLNDFPDTALDVVWHSFAPEQH